MEPGPPAPLETNTELLPFVNPRREIEKTDKERERRRKGRWAGKWATDSFDVTSEAFAIVTFAMATCHSHEIY